MVGELKHQAGHSTQLHDLEWLEGLLVLGLISLHDKRFGPASPDDAVSHQHAQPFPATHQSNHTNPKSAP